MPPRPLSLGGIPPFLLKTADNPEGVDGSVFEGSFVVELPNCDVDLLLGEVPRGTEVCTLDVGLGQFYACNVGHVKLCILEIRTL